MLELAVKTQNQEQKTIVLDRYRLDKKLAKAFFGNINLLQDKVNEVLINEAVNDKQSLTYIIQGIQLAISIFSRYQF